VRGSVSVPMIPDDLAPMSSDHDAVDRDSKALLASFKRADEIHYSFYRATQLC